MADQGFIGVVEEAAVVGESPGVGRVLVAGAGHVASHELVEPQPHGEDAAEGPRGVRVRLVDRLLVDRCADL